MRKDYNCSKNQSLKKELSYKDLLHHGKKALRISASYPSPERQTLSNWISALETQLKPKIHSHLYSESKYKLQNVTTVAPTYSPEVNKVDGRMIIRNNFKALFENNPKVLLFGEDGENW